MARPAGLVARLGRLAPALPALALWGAAAGCELLIDGELGTIRCSREGRSGPPDCLVGDVCVDHVCVEPAGLPSELGSRCEDDAGCAAGSFCLEPARFTGGGAFSAGKKRCSRPCCSSGDCGDPALGLVCAHPELGGPGYCRRAADVDRAAPGARLAAQACSAHEDCRSGLCDLAGDPATCLDGCCSDTSCSEAEAACRFSKRAPIQGFVCSMPAGLLSYGEPCDIDADCSSGICFDIGGARRCSAPCCSSTQCAPIAGHPVACADVPHALFVRACATLLSSAAVGEVGTPCESGAECRSGLCHHGAPDEARGQCTDTCCSDESCGAVGTFRCLPAMSGPPWPLRCEHN
jgi:hypothetical protein